jgi:hypothetical protein
VAATIILVHIPRLRIEGDEDLPIAGGVLTRLPWEFYDRITLGAFTDWRERYVATDPVFYWWQGDLDLPVIRPGAVSANRIQELKAPRAGWGELAWRLGLGVLDNVQVAVVDPLCAALTLVAPGASPAPPRSSVSFLLLPSDSPFHLELGGEPAFGARIQGEADQELVYGVDLAGPRLSAFTVACAAALVEPMSRACADDEVGPILRQLLATSDVSLSPTDRLTLAVAALEAALLPEIRTGLTETFARRLSMLVGSSDDERAAVAALGRRLYRLRSAALHGESVADGARTRPERAHLEAERLLADAVGAIWDRAEAGTSLDRLRQELDAASFERRESAATRDRTAVSAGDERLHPVPPWVSGTFTEGVCLAAPEGLLLSWSPLVGLGYDGNSVDSDLAVRLLPLDGREIVSMEEKDVRRDFIASVGMGGESVAGLATVAPSDGSGVLDETVIGRLMRRRDLAVVGLRLRGYDEFQDPELLGWYVYDGVMRHRRETVLRQSVLLGLGREPNQLLGADELPGVLAAWSSLADYEANARDAGLDWALDLFRRTHDRSFTAPETRASLLLCCLEATIGRFRGARAAPGLEDLVSALDGVDRAAADWFAAEGRSFRNAVAHGRWAPSTVPSHEAEPDDDLLRRLRSILRAALAESLEAWRNASAKARRSSGPRDVLTKVLEARVGL